MNFDAAHSPSGTVEKVRWLTFQTEALTPNHPDKAFLPSDHGR